MRMRDLSQLSMYDGEVAVLGYGEKRTFTGVSNGPISMVANGVLYAFSEGGNFMFEIVSPVDKCEVHFEGAKGVKMSLAKNPGATWKQGDPETSWTRDEPRPPVNPQLAALQHSIKTLEHRLAYTEAERAAAAALAAAAKAGATVVADQAEAASVTPENASEDASENTPE